VLIENAGHGGTFAAPVAKAVIEEYFKKDLTRQPEYTNGPAGGG